MKKAAEEVPTSQPRVVVKKVIGSVCDAYLVLEKQIVCKLPPDELPPAILAVLYVFNVHYPDGCSNLYSFFESALLQKKHGQRKTRLAGVMATLSNMD